MFKKQFTTISIATLATLGAFAMSVESASARPGGHGFRGHGFHGGYGRHWGHGHWEHRYGRGFYGAPIYVSTGAYALDCYYVRRRGLLFKVCD
jgi:hypothetical protein